QQNELGRRVLRRIEEDLKQMNRRDRDDRRGDLDLERTGINLAEPLEFAAMLVEPAHEVLITRDHHHDDQTRDERRVDKAEHLEDRISLLKGENHRQELIELLGE